MEIHWVGDSKEFREFFEKNRDNFGGNFFGIGLEEEQFEDYYDSWMDQPWVRRLGYGGTDGWEYLVVEAPEGFKFTIRQVATIGSLLKNCDDFLFVNDNTIALWWD